MRRNIRSEYRQSMDCLHFSRESKDAMLDALLAQMESAAPRRKRRSGKKLLFLTLAAALVLTMLTGAAAYTRWSKSMNVHYNATQQQREHAQKTGLSTLLETTPKDESQVVSATDQGITVTVVQTVADNYSMQITYRIEGYTLPDGADPALDGWVTSIGGDSDFYTSGTGSFFDGTMRNEKDEWVYLDGTPVAFDDSGSAILRYTDSDGALEYTMYYKFNDTSGSYFGKEIVVNFTGFGHSTGKAMHTIDVEGNWELRWTLTGAQSTLHYTPNAPIGDSGHTLLEAEVAPTALRAVLKTKDYFQGFETLEPFPTQLLGVQKKDGTIVCCAGGGREGYSDPDNLICELVVICNDILKPEDVTALVFLKSRPDGVRLRDLTEENFYIVPLS